jgi:hypothetical protein
LSGRRRRQAEALVKKAKRAVADAGLAKAKQAARRRRRRRVKKKEGEPARESPQRHTRATAPLIDD